MTNDNTRQKYIMNAAVCAAFLLTLAGLIKSVFISLDIDESYLAACACRIADGDGLFSDMWEPHQLASLIPSVFARIHVMTAGSTEGMIIFFRIISVLMHLGVGTALYFFVKKRSSSSAALLIFFLHINFLPKWVQSLDFELMAYWAVLGICMLLTGAGSSYLRYAISGVLLVIAMLSYPSLIILYPVFLTGILICTDRKCGIRGSVFFTIGCLIAGIPVLFLIKGDQSFSVMIGNVLNVFGNPSHATQPFCERITGYLADGAKAFLIWALISALSFAVIRFASGKKKTDVKMTAVHAMLASFMVLQAAMIAGCIFADKNQFFMQGRYAAIIVPGLFLALSERGKYRELLWFGFIPGLAAVPAVLAVTNMNAGTAWSKAMPAVLASVYVISSELINGKEKQDRIAKLSAVLLLAGLFLCRIGLIRVTGCLPVTVKADLEKVTAGPAEGVYILKDFAESANREYADLEGLYGPEDNVLYVGAEMLLYIGHPCKIASPSVEGTTIYDDYFLTYYDVHPERIPEYVVCDKNYPLIAEYRRYPQEYIIDEWIGENYHTVIKETPDLIIYGK